MCGDKSIENIDQFDKYCTLLIHPFPIIRAFICIHSTWLLFSSYHSWHHSTDFLAKMIWKSISTINSQEEIAKTQTDEGRNDDDDNDRNRRGEEERKKEKFVKFKKA
ncbi:hypothetical protein LOAG_14512 [Loa loa]|uniref:Uncharacterized protein n=1 Tax=Loa loa TaxID=7209 RepID=A0A1S0THH3_LOALO|nr:hypothetical protein LOAG_14512 [Loa loa]EFO14012.1 hypothetical protein LOAG_14512 [Loa loa]